ncbi:3-hydroxy-9,10-secoandrosta-1,3,5(10)-triene-9,17-dione monooxygenase oxygenase subunit, partial [Streptomyces sp. NPDC058171]
MTNEVLRSVRGLLPTIAEYADKVDESRRVSEQVIRELGDTGLFKMLQPRRYGGTESDPVHFYEVVRAVSGVCGSTGWLASVLGVHPWHLALFDDRAQRDVWGHDDSVLVSSAYAPVGRLVPVEGGYRLTGDWGFSSGCEHASWALLGAMLVGTEGRPVDFMTALVPRSDYRIHDVWDVVGMRGTASNEISARDVFVPDYRIKRNYETAQLRGPGQKVNRGPLYRLPFATLFTTAVAAPGVGIVAGCYERYLTVMRERVRLSLGGGRFVDDQFAQVAVARAASEIDAAILQTDRNVRELWELAEAGEELPMGLRLRVRRDQVRATERALEAIDLL